MDNTSCFIQNLPNEIVSMILRYNKSEEIVRFGRTCKRFHELVNNNQLLWRVKCKEIIPSEVFETFQKNNDVNWYNNVRHYLGIRKNIVDNLVFLFKGYKAGFNHIFFKINSTLEDIPIKFVKSLLLAALSSSYSLYYSLHILQDIVGGKYSNYCFSDVEVAFAKVTLRYLLHTYLSVNFAVHFENETEEALYPEKVLNLFLQWVDTSNLYLEEFVDNEILQLVEKIKMLLKLKPSKFSVGIQEPLNMANLPEKKILEAISDVIYKDLEIQITLDATMDLLNISKAIKNKRGNVITVAAIYQAIARHCGVKCELITFPNHFFLEWTDSSHPNNQTYTIDLNNGELKPKRRCPFSQTADRSIYKKNRPDQLLYYICSLYQMSYTAYKHSPYDMHNATLLQEFLNTGTDSVYKNFLACFSNDLLVPKKLAVNIKCPAGYLQYLKHYLLSENFN